MKRLLFALLLLATTALAQIATIQPGQSVASLSAATATGAGTMYQAKPVLGANPPNLWTWSVSATGGPASSTVNLEGSVDARQITDAKITAAAATLTSATAYFSAADVGKTIEIAGAGAAGVTLVTTITVFTNATTVTVNNAASTTVTAATAIYGHWFTLDSSATTTAEMRHVANKGVTFIRANLATLTGGTAPAVTATIMAAGN